MSKQHDLDPQAILRIVDAEVRKPRGDYGAEDRDASTFLKITGNQLGGSVDRVTVEAGNDALTNVHMTIATKGAGTLILDAVLSVIGGEVFMDGLPTADPQSKGQLWNDAGTLKVSAGK